MAPKVCTFLPYFFQLLGRAEVCKFLDFMDSPKYTLENGLLNLVTKPYLLILTGDGLVVNGRMFLTGKDKMDDI